MANNRGINFISYISRFFFLEELQKHKQDHSKLKEAYETQAQEVENLRNRLDKEEKVWIISYNIFIIMNTKQHTYHGFFIIVFGSLSEF